MPDREKVIKGLEEVDAYFHRMTEVCYRGDEATFCDLKEKVADALAMLKEQEPVKPTWSQGKAYCGKCGHRLPRKRADKEINYCGYCGQAVKWNVSN